MLYLSHAFGLKSKYLYHVYVCVCARIYPTDSEQLHYNFRILIWMKYLWLGLAYQESSVFTTLAQCFGLTKSLDPCKVMMFVCFSTTGINCVGVARTTSCDEGKESQL